SLGALQGVNPGFETSGILKAEFQLPASRYPQEQSAFPNWTASARFFREVESRVAAVSGVQSAALAVANPLDVGFTSSIRVVGREAEGAAWVEPSIRTVSQTYFATMGVPLVSGRPFDVSDAPTSAPVVVINETANQKYFGGKNAVGQLIALWGSNRLVIGVVGNEHFKGLAEAPPPAVYMPIAQMPMANTLLVKTAGDPLLLAATVRRIVREVDPQLPLFGVEPLEKTLQNTTGQRRFTMILLVVFASAALLLAVIGVHGVLSYAVSQRTREIGIRIALGADAHGVQALVVGQGARLTALGLVLGMGGAFALTRVLSSLLFGVGACDPLTFIVAPVLLGVVAIAATYLPARRASRTNPLTAIRSE
ncbi:MAG: ABC transporter permease, partial [Phycisphaerae bacterium]|nr:ABC transporter permease [Gemmatimonadaceae bacterium]